MNIIKMDKCPNCGANAGLSSVCVYCGSSLVKIVDPKTTSVDDSAEVELFTFPTVINALRNHLILAETKNNDDYVKTLLYAINNNNYPAISLISSCDSNLGLKEDNLFKDKKQVSIVLRYVFYTKTPDLSLRIEDRQRYKDFLADDISKLFIRQPIVYGVAFHLDLGNDPTIAAQILSNVMTEYYGYAKTAHIGYQTNLHQKSDYKDNYLVNLGETMSFNKARIMIFLATFMVVSYVIIVQPESYLHYFMIIPLMAILFILKGNLR